MSTPSKLRKSRAAWKDKAGQRADDNSQLRRDVVRLRKSRDHYKARCRLLEKTAKPAIAARVQPKNGVIEGALQLLLVVGIGFRTVSRVLRLLATPLGIGKPSCPQTIINWQIRMALGRVWRGRQLIGTFRDASFSNGSIFLMDTGIGLGSGKILTVLALNRHHHGLHDRVPVLPDVRCLAVSVANTWNGESIADFLKKLMGRVGRPAVWLKDGGTGLAKAIDLINASGAQVCIDDISHVSRQYNVHRLVGMGRKNPPARRFSFRIFQSLSRRPGNLENMPPFHQGISARCQSAVGLSEKIGKQGAKRRNP